MQFTDLKTQYQALKASIDARIQRVLDHGQYIMGPEVAEMEKALAARTGARHCVAVASGTEALLIALMALDLKPGDEVITTPFTFAATAEVIVLLGGQPVYVDIEPDTCNIDATLIEAAITPRTRAIMPVSLYGQVADMAEINAIAARHGLAVIEDAAQSFGASYQAKASCAVSTIGCTSFFPSKPLGCYGDGGALFTNDDAIAQAAREIRVHGQSARYTHTRLGLGGRMDTLQCAVVLGKLERFDWEIARRKQLGDRYGELIRRSGAPVQLLAVRPDRDCVWAQYTVMLDHRAAVQQALQAAGVPTAIHYPKPLHHQPAYAAGCDPLAHPASIAAAQRVMSLPMSADLGDADQQRVVDALAQACAGVAAVAGAAGLAQPA
ncbi:DegT/DnrJ/EryC1/StrS family aminotransferase [Aquabacterium sp. OR-4]|uniref:DegT/DnrJ/EryC1/StrS family aminotransferase n=1 Tax=Aquabacterium sp. OR-4 TaxID=2978127 RepID=UPI0021B3126F|nr:DegT/DnrJ/EryC1/StrS family aminotransferase [Aquabacterium sp. OR-4]MDT7834472.1 DegT/DnrJ/EryC1/StrS family aminotransferase [Aquabacterium sp. OR-4]